MNIKNQIHKIVFLSLAIISSYAYANDTYMGSKNGTVFPDKSHSIQMMKERIYVSFYRDSCVVKCKFWFYNHSFVENVEVGFPNFSGYEEYESPPLKNFTATINGRHVNVGEAKLEKRYGDQIEYTNSWFIWRVKFPGKETTIIENTYSGSWGGNYYSKNFSYTIGTGKTWYDKIVDGEIVFDHSNLASSSFVKISASKIPGLKKKANENSTIFKFKNVAPHARDTFHLEVLSYWDFDFDSLFEENLLKRIKSGGEPRMMRNEIFARHGYKFKDLKLQKYFENQSWYEINPNFTFELLNEKELKTVEFIKKYEKSLRVN